MDASQISLLLAGGRTGVTETLRAVFENSSEFEVLDEALDGATAVAKTSMLNPDIVILSMALSDKTGTDVSEAISHAGLKTKIILLIDDIEDANGFLRAMDAGVIGGLYATASADEIKTAVRKAFIGAPAFHPDIQKVILSHSKNLRALDQELTDREIVILREITAGKTNREIAIELGLTEGTVKGYVSVILSKLGVKDRVQAALCAVRHGLVMT